MRMQSLSMRGSCTCAQACRRAPNVLLSGLNPLRAISLNLSKAALVLPTCTGDDNELNLTTLLPISCMVTWISGLCVAKFSRI